MSDIRYALRSLLHARWFTVGAIVTFALGIGVNVAVFSLVDRLMFRPLPYARPGELVVIVPTDAGRMYLRTPKPIVVGAKTNTEVFSDVAIAGQARDYLFDPAAPDAPPVRLTEGTYNLLGVLGIHPLVGRDFNRDDAVVKRRLGLISYEVWQRRFGGRADVVGRRLGGASSVEIVGVLPKGFIPPSMFAPVPTDGLSLDADLLSTSSPGEGVWPAVARLREGVSMAGAQSSIDALAARVSPSIVRPGDHPLQMLVAPLQFGMFKRFQTSLWLVVAAAAMVLLIACANLSSLFLARGRSREQNVALCSALGASSFRLMAAGFAECLVVTLAGALIALAAVMATGRALVLVEPTELQQFAVDVTDGRVLLVALIAVFGCTIVAGILPSMRTVRVDLLAVLRHGTKSGRRGRGVASRSLLAVEAAFGMVLVAGAVLTGRSLVGLQERDLGFVPRDLFVISAQLPSSELAASKMAMYAQARELLRRQPGVESVGGVDAFSFGGSAAMRGFPSPERTQEGGLYQVAGDYFEAMRTPIVAGRAITDEDTRHDAPVAVISERGARVLWPDVPIRSVIGRTLRVANEPDRSVVGIAADQRAYALTEPAAGAFVPYGHADPKLAEHATVMEIVVRMQRAARPNVASLRAGLRDRFPLVTVTADDVLGLLDPWMRQPKFQAYLLGSFAVAGLMLAAIGLYAVASFDVSLRKYEMGVRMTLGARPTQLHWAVMKASLAPVAAGVAVGLLGARWAAQFLQSFLADVSARDPLLTASAAATLLGAAVLAAWLPARRAARTDPAVVLRTQ